MKRPTAIPQHLWDNFSDEARAMVSTLVERLECRIAELEEKLNRNSTNSSKTQSSDPIGGYGLWELVPDAAAEEVADRTPCFTGAQQDRWFTHCGEAAEFLAIVGRAELEAFGAEAIDAIRQKCGYEGEEWESYFRSLDRVQGPSAYIFRCRHCGKLGGYSDRP